MRYVEFKDANRRELQRCLAGLTTAQRATHFDIPSPYTFWKAVTVQELVGHRHVNTTMITVLPFAPLILFVIPKAFVVMPEPGKSIPGRLTKRRSRRKESAAHR